MKKKWEVRYLVTAAASIPVYKAYGKTETYRQAAKDGWGTVCRDENNALVCDEDCSASLYTKNGGYFGILPYEEINAREMPKQAECAAIIVSDSCGFTVWAEDFSRIHIFVTRDENGLIDTYRVEYGESPICDGEVEISFEDLCQNEDSWDHSYRASIPGTVEYSRKQETAQTEQDAPEAAEDRQQNAPSAASLIVIAAAEMQDRTQAQEAAAGEPKAEERKKNGGGAGPPPQEKGEQGVNSGAAV